MPGSVYNIWINNDGGGASFVEDPDNPLPPQSSAASAVPASTDKYYIAAIHNMAAMDLSTLFIDYSHLIYWSEKNVLGFSEAITERHYRFLPFLRRGLETCIRRHEPEYWGKAGRGVGGSEGVGPTFILSLRAPDDHKLTPHRLIQPPTKFSPSAFTTSQ